jgi:hypothetical protein
MKTSGIASIVLLSTLGCAAHAAGGPPTAWESTDEIVDRPAALVGQGADLRISNNVLSGQLEGGAYHVLITRDEARGDGPMGRVDVHIKRLGQGYELAGLWNGGHVDFFVGQDGAHGQLIKQISGEDRGYESCHYDIARSAHGGYTGLSQCLGVEPLRFDLAARTPSDLVSEQNAILLLAYFAAPPPVRTL